MLIKNLFATISVSCLDIHVTAFCIHLHTFNILYVINCYPVSVYEVFCCHRKDLPVSHYRPLLKTDLHTSTMVTLLTTVYSLQSLTFLLNESLSCCTLVFTLVSIINFAPVCWRMTQSMIFNSLEAVYISRYSLKYR